MLYSSYFSLLSCNSLSKKFSYYSQFSILYSLTSYLSRHRTSIRILGPLAGLLVALYAFRKHGKQALPTLIIYAGFALAAMYATWPYLWPTGWTFDQSAAYPKKSSPGECGHRSCRHWTGIERLAGSPPGREIEVKSAHDATFENGFLIFLAVAVIGILITRHYGELWDELKFYKYADLSLAGLYHLAHHRSGAGVWQHLRQLRSGLRHAGGLGARALQFVLPWSLSDLRHLLYFFTFLAGVWAFYSLAKRWLSQTAALGATVLFATQPLFWGHAFISPKDIPFLSFFPAVSFFWIETF